MTDPMADEIRVLLERATTGSPEPHPWADVERRVLEHGDPPTVRRRTGVWLAVAACLVALVGGLVVVVGVGADSDVRLDDDPVTTTTVHVDVVPIVPESTTPSTPSSTTAPTSAPVPTTTTLPETEPGWSGGLLDDLDTESLRPLDSYAPGDVVVPTGPSGWRIDNSTWTNPDDEVGTDFVEWSVDVFEARTDRGLGHVLYLRQSLEPICITSLGCRPSGDSLTINGVVWEAIEVEEIPEYDDQFFDETTLRAQVGDRWLSVSSGAPQALSGRLLDDPQVIEFIEGLRVGSPEDLAAIGEACWQCGSAGAEGDPFAEAESPTSTPITPSDSTPTTSEPRAQAPGDVDSDMGRPLTDLVEGDVVVPSYVPPGLALRGEAQIYNHPTVSEFQFDLETADGKPSNSVRLWERDETAKPVALADLDDPNHPPVEIAGITWGWNDFESARIAHIGAFDVWVYLHGLDEVEARRFIEGLRAVPIQQFPGPIAVDGADGLSVIDLNDPSDAEIVATDDRFELVAVQVGDQVCTKLEETTVPVTMNFGASCWESTRLTEPGVVDLYALDATDTSHLIIGVVDAPNATAVRLTSPGGTSIVVPTGPVNQAIDGRFFLARLELDASNGIRLDRFTIEDASSLPDG